MKYGGDSGHPAQIAPAGPVGVCTRFLQVLRGGGVVFGVVFGALAVIFATINVVGGYVVTNRMLRMFNRDKK